MRNVRNNVGALLVAGAVALLGLGCASRSAVPYQQGAERYQFQFHLTRAQGEIGSCTASASVIDRMAHRGIVIPIFTALWGSKTTAAWSDSAYAARLDVSVTVDASGERGTFEAALRRGDRLIASRSSSLAVTVVRLSSKGKLR